MASPSLPRFIARWQRSTLTERSAAESHFFELCGLLGQQTPAEADPAGESYTFEKGVTKSSGGEGFADVWMKERTLTNLYSASPGSPGPTSGSTAPSWTPTVGRTIWGTSKPWSGLLVLNLTRVSAEGTRAAPRAQEDQVVTLPVLVSHRR